MAHAMHSMYDSLAEWSKALAPGARLQGRGLEPHSFHAPLSRMRAHLHTPRAAALSCGAFG